MKATAAATPSRPSCSSPTTSATATRSATAPSPPALEHEARLAVANCPEHAIDVVEERARWASTTPVTDWATDFDHTDDAWAADPFPIWDELRATLPGRPHRPLRRRRGCRRATTTCAAIAYDTEHFTSRSVIVSNFRPPDRPGARRASRRRSPPTRRSTRTRAGCCCRPSRPQAIDKLEPSTARVLPRADRRLRGPATSSTPRPTTPSTSRCGSSPTCSACPRRTPTSSAASSTTCSKASPCRSRSASAGIDRPLRLPRARRSTTTSPTRATTSSSFLLDAELDGQKLDADPRRAARSALLLIAGIDTTWSADRRVALAPGQAPRPTASGSSPSPSCCRPRWRSSSGPTRRSRWPGSCKEDIDFNGCPMKADDWVLLPFPAANRDPEQFERRRRGRHRPRGQPPRRVRPRHPPLRRLAPGPHGAARRARGVAGAFPEFDLADPEAVRWSAGQVRGPRTLPVAID